MLARHDVARVGAASVECHQRRTKRVTQPLLVERAARVEAASRGYMQQAGDIDAVELESVAFTGEIRIRLGDSAQQRAGVRMLWCVDYDWRGAVLDDASEVHHRDVPGPGEVLGDGQGVRNKQEPNAH